MFIFCEIALKLLGLLSLSFDFKYISLAFVMSVDEHLDNLHRAQDKAATVSKFKEEMLLKVEEHKATVVGM